MEMNQFRVLVALAIFIHSATASCLQGCLTCSQSGQCLQCSSYHYIAIASLPTNGCLPCRPECKTCSSETSFCTTCAPGFYLAYNNTSPICQTCQVNYCSSCEEDPAYCSSCQAGYFLIASTGMCESCEIYEYSLTCRESVILSCMEGYYVANGQKCEKCSQDCKKCTSPFYCLQCLDGYYGSSCSACPSNCKNCLTSTSCLACSPGFYLKEKKCVRCPDPACQICSATGTCSQCQENYYLSSDEECIQRDEPSGIMGCTEYTQKDHNGSITCGQCDSFFFLDEGRKCHHCSILCQKCQGYYSSSCTHCADQFAYQPAASICTIRPSLRDGSKTKYISKWGYPSLFAELGSNKIVYNSKCPVSKYSTSTRAELGMISGYAMRFEIKIAFFAEVESSSFDLTLSMNSLYDSNYTLNLSSLASCTLQENATSNLQYTTTLTFTVSPQFSHLHPLNKGISTNFLQMQAISNSLYLSFVQIALIYKPCHSSCLLCSPDHCQLCSEGMLKQEDKCVPMCSQFFYYLQPTACVKACPIATYENNEMEEWTCSLCHPNCSACISLSKCTQCREGSYLTPDHTCLQSCPSTFYPSNQSRRCQSCPAPCQTCSSPTFCLSCSYNYLFDGLCISGADCPVSTYPDIDAMQCEPCLYPCLSCLSKHSCLGCIDGHLLENTCYSQCPEGYFGSLGSCLACNSSCLTCSSENNCTVCRNAFLLRNATNNSGNLCYDTCPKGYFEHYSDMTCSPCQQPCSTCINNPKKCTSCPLNYILHRDKHTCTTIEQCLNDSTSRLMAISNAQFCTLCPPECLSCNAQDCLFCNTGYYLLNGICLISCPSGMFAAHGFCKPCSPSCSTCLGEEDFCLSCPQDRHLSYLNFCEQGCSEGQLYPSCEQCQSPCQSCEGEISNCSSCMSGFYLFWANQTHSLCLSTCYNGYFADPDTQQCLPCTNNCQTCISSSNGISCLACENGLFLEINNLLTSSGLCVNECNSGWFGSNIVGACQKCSDVCSQCEGYSDNCTSCNEGTFLQHGHCVHSCQQGSYQDSLNWLCLQCVEPCLGCQPDGKCLSCVAGFFLNGEGLCLQKCAPGSMGWPLTGSCESCSFPCAACEEDPQHCTKCQQPGCPNDDPDCYSYFLFQSECLSACPATTYPDSPSASCKPCPQPCLQCTSPNSCLSCLAGTYFLEKKCLHQCPSGFYHDPESGICAKCLYPCKECISESQCKSCLDGVRVGSHCIFTDSCASGFYLQYYFGETNAICEQCDPRCLECTQTESYCVICKDSNLMLSNGECINQCPKGYYPEQKLVTGYGNGSIYQKICSICPSQCVSCDSASHCTACRVGHYLHAGQCQEVCPPSFYSIESPDPRCLPCSQSCRTCVQSAQTCTSCYNNSYMNPQEQSCVETCPSHTYIDQYSEPGANTGLCRECDFPCASCSNAEDCNMCVQGFFMTESKICTKECSRDQFISSNGVMCLQACPPTQFIKHYELYSLCSKNCELPFIIQRQQNQRVSCVRECLSHKMLVNADLECVLATGKEQVIGVEVHGYLDADYTMKVLVEFDQGVDYEEMALRMEDAVQVQISNSPLFQKRMLQSQSEQAAFASIEHELIEQTDNYILLGLAAIDLPEQSAGSEFLLKLSFREQSNLLIRSQYNSLPVQNSHYFISVPYYEYYGQENTFMTFKVFGNVWVIFILSISLCLLVNNWYAKIYEILHLLQLLFLLSLLHIAMPPNIWLFLQGFRNAHFYFVGNWFIDPKLYATLCDSSAKIMAIFHDSNFFRICGHIFCLFFIICAVCMFLFLSRWGRESRWKWVAYICLKLSNRLKLLKWSHTHDLVMSVSMILIFGFFAQMSDYHTQSTIQSLAILFSFISVMAITAYYIFMGRKLHHIIQLSERDTRSFCERNYLFRDNMMSITECAVHPKELYLNYVRAFRIIVFGAVIGAFSISPMLCTSTIMITLLLSAILYLGIGPYPDHLQNKLLGLADIATACGIFFLSFLHFLTTDKSHFEKEEYFRRKWVLAWFSIICFILALLFLMVELIVSIVRGNSSPKKLTAEDVKKEVMKKKAPSKIMAVPKHELQGWAHLEGQSAIGVQYKVLED